MYLSSSFYSRSIPNDPVLSTKPGLCLSRGETLISAYRLRHGDISLLRRKVVTPEHPDKVHYVLHLVLPMSYKGITFPAAQRKMFHP